MKNGCGAHASKHFNLSVTSSHNCHRTSAYRHISYSVRRLYHKVTESTECRRKYGLELLHRDGEQIFGLYVLFRAVWRHRKWLWGRRHVSSYPGPDFVFIKNIYKTTKMPSDFALKTSYMRILHNCKSRFKTITCAEGLCPFLICYRHRYNNFHLSTPHCLYSHLLIRLEILPLK